MQKQRIYQLLRFCTVLVSVITVFLIMQYTFSYIYPFLLAAILSLLLNPVVTILEKITKMPRGLLTFIVLTFTATVFLGLMFLVISELIQGTTYLANSIPDHFRTFVMFTEQVINERILPLYHRLVSFVHTLDPEQQASINQSIHYVIEQFASFSTDFLKSLLSQVPGALALLPGSATVFLFIIMAAFFMTKDWRTLVTSAQTIIPNNVLHSSSNVWHHLQKALAGFFKAQLLLISMTTLTILTGLWLFQVDYALTIALFAAVADVLPFIGTGILFVPWIIYLFLTGDYDLTIALSILYMIVVVQRQLLEPKIVAGHAGLNPLAVLAAVFIGIQIWGAFGLLLGPFFVITVNAFYQAGIFHQISQYIKGS